MNVRIWIGGSVVALAIVGALVFQVFTTSTPIAEETPQLLEEERSILVSSTSPEVSSQSVVQKSAPDATRLTSEEIARWYGNNLVPITIGTQSRLASVADTFEKRQLGLSNTPLLPPEIVKLFVFESSSAWSFWMKDMNYAIDIIWLDENKRVVHVLSNVSPDSYPQSFVPPVPARFVIETVPGFAVESAIEIGTMVTFDL